MVHLDFTESWGNRRQTVVEMDVTIVLTARSRCIGPIQLMIATYGPGPDTLPASRVHQPPPVPGMTMTLDCCCLLQTFLSWPHYMGIPWTSSPSWKKAKRKEKLISTSQLLFIFDHEVEFYNMSTTGLLTKVYQGPPHAQSRSSQSWLQSNYKHYRCDWPSLLLLLLLLMSSNCF